MWLDHVESSFRTDRLWQWAWDRHGTRYSWAVVALTYVLNLPIWGLAAFIVLVYEESDRFLLAASIVAVAEFVALYLGVRPGSGVWRQMERWAAGDQIDRYEAIILFTQHTLDVLASAPEGLIDRGHCDLKGKSSSVRVYGL